MAHFAEIDDDNVVLRVIVIDNDDITDEDGNDDEAAGVAICRHHCGEDTNWVQTSYNNKFRLQFAGVGMVYDTVHDTFRAPNAPFPSWTLSATTGNWEPPTPEPEHGYYWDEDTTAWVQPEAPFPSWVWTEGQWEAPSPYPGATDGTPPAYDWDEDSTSWVVWEG